MLSADADVNWIVSIASAMIGAAATLLAVWPAIARTKREAAALYLEAMAAAALGMAQTFTVGDVPFDHGHAYDDLVKDYAQKIGPYVGEKLHRDVERFLDVAQRAKDTDDRIAKNILRPDEDITELINDLRRLAGSLRAQAASIRVG